MHAARSLLDQNDENTFLMNIDFINAFNLVDRKAAVKEIKSHIPELAHWVASCYMIEAFLVYGETTILNSRGFHQGEPLASLLFSLVLQSLIVRLRDTIPSLKLYCWFLEEVLCVEEGPTRGLEMSTKLMAQLESKSSVWCLAQPRSWCHGLLQ